MIGYLQVKPMDGLLEEIVVYPLHQPVRIMIWMTEEELQENVVTDEEYLVACYVPVPNRNEYFAEIHFCNSLITNDMIVHELLHLHIDLLRSFEVDEEDMADAITEVYSRISAKFLEIP